MRSTILAVSLLTASSVAFPLLPRDNTAGLLLPRADCQGGLFSLLTSWFSSCDNNKKPASTTQPRPSQSDDLDLDDPAPIPYYNPGGFTPVTGPGVFGSLPQFQAQDGESMPEDPEEEGPYQSGEAAWPDPALQQPPPYLGPQPTGPAYPPPPTQPVQQQPPPRPSGGSRPKDNDDEDDDGWNFGWDDEDEDDSKLAR